MQNHYEAVQNLLLNAFPGQHELQTAQFQINDIHKFVITTKLAFQCTETTARLTTSGKRAASIVNAALQLAHSHDFNKVETVKKLKIFPQANKNSGSLSFL
jgi:hypothetical protein